MSCICNTYPGLVDLQLEYALPYFLNVGGSAIELVDLEKPREGGLPSLRLTLMFRLLSFLDKSFNIVHVLSSCP
jgi:hypothetical protein